MHEEFSRTKNLIGEIALNKLKKCHIAIFGIGGVGGYSAEAIARAGVGEITLVDNDTVSLSNINRQIIATHSTVGKPKVEVMKERILDINPTAKVNTYNILYLPETAKLFDFSKFDYVIDAIDNVTGKIQLVINANECNTAIISSMGTGNKLNPLDFEVSDIYKTSVCPLARVMRYELKKRGIRKLKVVYSKETPIKSGELTPSSISFVPPVAGLIIASEVIKDIIK